MRTSIPDRIAERPDLIDQFRKIEGALMRVLANGAETGPVRREFEELTRKTKVELRTDQAPIGADFAKADLIRSARFVSSEIKRAHIEVAPEIAPPVVEHSRSARLKL